MKQKNQKKYNKLFIQKTLIILFISMQYTSGSIINNYNIDTQIYSDYQNINIKTNTLTIKGNITIQNEYTNIYADIIIIQYANRNHKKKIINAYGLPVIFYQNKNNKEPILATCLHMSYNTINNIIILQGKAYIKKKNYVLQSDCIKYTEKNKCIETYNNEKQNTKTILTINTYKNNNLHLLNYTTNNK